MTTRPDHHEPLDADERDLAARLGRAGPVEGPSPTLDARILAAAHAAAATHKPRRHGRLAWFGLPPAVITGVGVAAAAVLALGLVWQVRPQYGRTVTQAEGDAGEEVLIFAEPASEPRAQRANPPALPDADRGEATAASQPAAAAAVADSTDAARVAAERAASERAASERAASELTALQRAASAAAQREASAAKAAMQAAPAPLDAPREADAASDAAANAGFTPEPTAAATAARKSHATYTTAARATAERRGERAPTMAADPSPAPAAVAAPAPPPPPISAAEAERATLDRIEVTGSRIRADTDWSQVPIRDDAKLTAAEWLERIRARRDGDDVDNARASLRLFRREHPRVRIPDDLQALLAAEAAR